MVDKEYIERGAVEEFIRKGLNNPDRSKAYGYDAVEILSEVHYMDAADVVEVKHGTWKLHLNGSGTCDQCHFTQRGVYDQDSWQRFCGRCGARMENITCEE